MGSAFAAYPIACGIAALLAFLEQYNRLHSRFTLRRWLWAWWAGRLVLEASFAAIAVTALLLTLEPKGMKALLLWLGAGVGAPSVVRARFIDIGRGEGLHPAGPAIVYERMRSFIERHIDDLGAAEQARWLKEVVLPRLAQQNVTPDHLAQRMRDYIRGQRLSGTERATEFGFITKQLKSDQPPRIKREALARRAVFHLRAYRLIKDLAGGPPDVAASRSRRARRRGD